MTNIPPSSDQTDVSAALQRLEDRAYKTYRSRLHAAKRLASRHQAWNASLIASSTATTIAAVALLSDEAIYGDAGPTLVVCASILTLVASLVSSALDYSGRSRDMSVNYRRIQRLSVEVELLRTGPVELQTIQSMRDLHERYDALLDESENHSQADFYHAFPAEKKPAWIWVQDLLSLFPYVALLAPVGLLIPFADWVASGSTP